jgi:hypothetical protein
MTVIKFYPSKIDFDYMHFVSELVKDKMLTSCYNHDIPMMIKRLSGWYDLNKWFVFDDHITLTSSYMSCYYDEFVYLKKLEDEKFKDLVSNYLKMIRPMYYNTKFNSV